MELKNFDDFPREKEIYGFGGSCWKQAIVYKDNVYMLKYPNKHHPNSPLVEWIGSNIYKMLGINVHETLLGISKEVERVVVACKLFTNRGDEVYGFDKLKNMGTPDKIDKIQIKGNSPIDKANYAVSILKAGIFSSFADELEAHLWDMCVVDMLIGNLRKDSDWGLVKRVEDDCEVAPVYDNGDSFEDTTIRTIKDLNYKSLNCEGFNKSILRLVPVMLKKQSEFEALIDAIPERFKDVEIISWEQREFYKGFLKARLNNILIPLYKKVSPTKKFSLLFQQ